MTEAEGEPSAAPRPYVRCAAIRLLPCLSHPPTGGAGRSQDHRNSDVHLEGSHRDPTGKLEELGPSLCPLSSGTEKRGLWGTTKGHQGRQQRADALHIDLPVCKVISQDVWVAITSREESIMTNGTNRYF